MQDAEYLAAHARLVELEAENAALKAENAQLREQIRNLVATDAEIMTISNTAVAPEKTTEKPAESE